MSETGGLVRLVGDRLTEQVGAVRLLRAGAAIAFVALALTEYFDVPPENLVVQGYGESELLVPTGSDERANRRVAVRIITALLQQTAR